MFKLKVNYNFIKKKINSLIKIKQLIKYIIFLKIIILYNFI